MWIFGSCDWQRSLFLLCVPSLTFTHLNCPPPRNLQSQSLSLSLLFRHSPFRQHKTKDKHEIDRMTLTMVRHLYTLQPAAHRDKGAHNVGHAYYKQTLCTWWKAHRQYESLLNPEHTGLVCVYLAVIPKAHRCLYPYAYWTVCEQTADAW